MSGVDLLESYTALSSLSSRTVVLQSIINAPPFTFNNDTRKTLIDTILRDLKTTSKHGTSNGRLSSKDAAQALLAVKTLGKNPSGSETLATASTLSALLGLSISLKDDPEASSEALRCIANTMLLFEHARGTFIGKDVGGGETCVGMLDKSTTPDQVFILSRILFLATVPGPSWIVSLVEDHNHKRRGIVDIIASKLDAMLVAIQAGTKLGREAMADLLKFTFNLLLHYPKMVDAEPQTPQAGDGQKAMGDFWSPNLDGLLPSLLRTFYSLPPTFPSPLVSPLTHVIHALITIPISSSLKLIWLGPSTPERRSSSNSSSPKMSTSSGGDSPVLSQTPPKSSTLDRALSVLSVAGRRSLSRSPSPNTATPQDILLRAHDLLEVSFSHYFPGSIDPDDSSVRERPKKEQLDGSLDDIISPLIVLITRLCLADATSRGRLREWIVPPDLDRSAPLEGRSDMLGRCLRLMGSVYHPRLKDSVGEMLFAMSDSDARILSSLVGYGNVAGFLFNKGIMSAPPPPGGEDPSSSTEPVAPDGKVINPITGNTMEKPDLPDMTEEEKEQEMEKLFVLFDRLEKSGALPKSQNPIRKAMEKAASQ
ncbi:guanine nucleotide exchange factor [Desarmillaria tabescens]|uniref:Guanine nucleotide exchange factor n=1 Tax=Armillaria tabescens TaxID=1929756 RepID=A0AA39JZV2_ARMTA|nr:guanine nucleotide exchange factor [Desarmillaria tabescens]KAK0451971.1 guanine nucleotide exchange factor [Desarmillaria tabescens]